jgi:hypothetical protein
MNQRMEHYLKQFFQRIKKNSAKSKCGLLLGHELTFVSTVTKLFDNNLDFGGTKLERF